MKKTIKYRVISPDGFDIERDKFYDSKEEAMIEFNKWKERYRSQGYYSTISNNERVQIPLKELIDYMEFVEIEIEDAIEFKAIAVIDSSIKGLFIYDCPVEFNDEEIEEFVHSNGHHLSNCVWGEFDGEIEDQRD